MIYSPSRLPAPPSMGRARSSRAFEPVVLLLLALLVVACSSGRHGAASELSASALANVNAELRMVGGETTWVARGTGYELNARSKRDIAILQPQLDRQAALFRALFSVDPTKLQLAVVHSVSNDAAATTPVLPEPGVPLVMVLIGGGPGAPGGRKDGSGDSRTRDEGERARRGGAGDGSAWMGRQGGPGAPLRQLVRAWLSARASALTSHAAGFAQASGEANDPRVAAWAEDALLGLTADSARVDAVAHQLIASATLYPLSEFFTMERPPNVVRQLAETEGRGAGERPQGGLGGRGGGIGGGGRGGRGGMGGRMGGRGGMGGGMGRGGGQQGGGQRSGGGAGAFPLSGGMLFAAEALVLSECLAQNEGTAFVGRLIETQMVGKPITDALGTSKTLPSDLTQLDAYWRRWMALRLQSANAR